MLDVDAYDPKETAKWLRACLPLAHAEMLRSWDSAEVGGNVVALPFIGTQAWDVAVLARASVMVTSMFAALAPSEEFEEACVHAAAKSKGIP